MATETKPAAALLCICGRFLRDPTGKRDNEELARAHRWRYFRNAIQKDGVNALCPECEDNCDE